MSIGTEQEPLLSKMNVYYFAEDFKTSTTKPVIEWILAKNFLPDDKRPDDLVLVLNSPGGDVHSCFALIDIMKGSSIPVNTIGLGLIASCGILTFMTGKHRVVTPNTSIMSHQYAWGSAGKEHELFARVREFELSTERMLEHYKKCTGLTEKKIRKYLLPAQDVWLNAQEAVDLGIADEVREMY